MPVMINGLDPKFVTVSVSVALVPGRTVPKSRLAGVNDRAEVAPDPVRLTARWPTAVLSVTVRVPVLVPVWLGVKVTSTVQLAVGASMVGNAPQVFCCPKSPLALMAEMARDSFPLL